MLRLISISEREKTMSNSLYIRIYHIVTEAVSGVIMLLSLVLSVVLAIGAKGEIPTHFDVFGNPTSYGSPWTSLVLPVTHFICNAVISGILHFYPIEKWNMPKTTDNSRPYVYRDTIWLLVVTHLIVSVISLVSVICTFFARRSLGPVCTLMAFGLVAVVIALSVKTAVDAKKYA